MFLKLLSLLMLIKQGSPILVSAVVFTPFRNPDHPVTSISVDFPSNLNWYVSFLCTFFDNSCVHWDGSLDHLTDDPWERGYL